MCICVSCMCKVMDFIRILLFESINGDWFSVPINLPVLAPARLLSPPPPFISMAYVYLYILYIYIPPQWRFHTWKKNMVCFFWIWLISLQQHTMSSVFLKIAYFLSYLWIKLLCVCTPHFLYSFTGWWTPRLFPIGYCSWCCNQPRWAIISVACWLRLLWIYFQERLSLITSLLVGM